MKYLIKTYGCQMNEHDSEIMAGLLRGMGFSEAERAEEADVILVNTCSIRETAVDKILGTVGDLKALKRARPGLIVGMAGCLPQHQDELERVLKRAPHLDLVLGTHNLHRLPELVAQARGAPGTVVEVWPEAREDAAELPVLRAGRVKAWVTIIHGCDKRCSYCVVPGTRGPERSRPLEEIRREVEGLAAAGYKEVTLLGQNVNAYGKDLRPRLSFADLLREVDGIEGIERIRFMTPHPRDFTPEMVEAIAAARHACEHVHLPVQSGSNAVLRAMRRSYTREHYLGLVGLIRDRIPGVSLTTDVIVGFPGEGEAEFRETLDLVSEVGFDAAYTFMFSARAGTPAATLPEQVEREVKKERLARLMTLQNAVSLRRNRELVGRVVEVLVEGPSRSNPEMLTGRTRGNKIVLFPGEGELAGELATVEVLAARTWTLHGGAPRPRREPS